MPTKNTQKPEAIAADLQKLVGLNLRMHREKRSLTQEQLAHSAGMATRHLQKIEAGRVNVTIRTIARLIHALGLEPQALVAKQTGDQSR